MAGTEGVRSASSGILAVSAPSGACVAGPATDVSDVLGGLASRVHLARDRALSAIPLLPPDQLVHLSEGVLDRFATEDTWEVISSNLAASSSLLACLTAAEKRNADFASLLLPHALHCILHQEPRVRNAAASLLGDIGRALGSEVWVTTRETLFEGVRRNFDLDDAQRIEEASRVATRDMSIPAESKKDRGLRMVHETEGWRGLETSLLALGEVLLGCGEEILRRAGDDVGDDVDIVLEFIARARTHPNRFIREAGLRVFAAVIDSCVAAKKEDLLLHVVRKYGDVVSAGLQDNWSQVRYVASVATRKLFLGLAEDTRVEFFPSLLPRMLLNRHYVAEGVKMYSQETWRTLFKAGGRHHVVRLMDNVVEFLESQCAADNHAVREAACHCIGECCSRLEKKPVEPFVPRMFKALIEAFKDESWPVRDIACSALSALVSSFPAEVEETGQLRELFLLFEAHLSDNISSVRQNTAQSFVLAAKAYPISHPVFGFEALARCTSRLLPRIRNQREKNYVANGGCNFSRRDRFTGYGAAAKVARDNDVALHTGQVMYSCGSLAPKLRRGGGCMDHGFTRAKAAWEETDGAVWLWRFLTLERHEGSKLGSNLLPDVLAALRVSVAKDFAHAGLSQESFLLCLTAAARYVAPEAWTADLLALSTRLVDRVVQKNESSRPVTAAKSAQRALRSIAGLRGRG